MSYFLRPDGELAIAEVPKAGLMTIREWLTGFAVVKNDDERLLACPVRVLFVRNPLARIQSCFSFLRRCKDNGNRMKHGAPLDSWPAFVDYFLEHDNMHWTPQIEHAGHLQTVVHRFEELNNIFYRYHENIVLHSNPTRRVPVDNYRLSDIVDYYMDDFNIWLGAEL